VRDTPPELGTTQSLFDIVALGDLTETAPKYLVNLGARMEWSRLSLSVHELVYGPASQWENDGGATDGYFDGTPPPPSNLPDPTPGGLRFYKTEIPATPITNLELSWEAMDNLSVIVGATNVFDEKPDKRNDTLREIQFGTGDNSAVAGYPSFSPFGINGAYYYGKLMFSF
jgi:iron complex outermembrane recepter protein